MVSIGKNEKVHHRQVLTDEIVASMQKGTAPWQKPWPKGLKKERPVSFLTGKEYRGGNFLCLSAAPYADPRWLTFKQAANKKWNVRKGERGRYIEYISWYERKKERDPETGEIVIEELKRDNPIIRRSTVFNGEQIEGITDYFKEALRFLPEKEIIEGAQKTIERSGAKIVFDSPGEAYYNRNSDTIHMTPKETFKSTYDMYSSILHQLAHWTAHESRLDRKENSAVENPAEYAREELRAELASYFMAFDLGIGLTQEHIDNHASFTKQWLELLGSNRNEIYRIAKDAESIASYIYDISRDPEKTEQEEVESTKTTAATVVKPAVETIKPEVTPVPDDAAQKAQKEAERAQATAESVKREEIEREKDIFIEIQKEKYAEDNAKPVPAGVTEEEIEEFVESFIDF